MKEIENLKNIKTLSKKDQSHISGNGLVICRVFCPTYCICLGDRCEYPNGAYCSPL
ncbi:hypothetical protein [Aquimarina sediminis]|uniref:hypothetical protein n=1 Tax=Aquimarina sediminis TaxID=2070536 RepID=UPI0019D41387|nr:hypothetical protein [Aquimarina sediminis]